MECCCVLDLSINLLSICVYLYYLCYQLNFKECFKDLCVNFMWYTQTNSPLSVCECLYFLCEQLKISCTIAIFVFNVYSFRKYATSKSAPEFQSFLRLASYFMTIIAEFKWANGCEAAFKELKAGPISATILAYPHLTPSVTPFIHCKMLTLVSLFLKPKPFKVRTGRQALVWLNNFKKPEGQTAHWQKA